MESRPVDYIEEYKRTLNALEEVLRTTLQTFPRRMVNGKELVFLATPKADSTDEDPPTFMYRKFMKFIDANPGEAKDVTVFKDGVAADENMVVIVVWMCLYCGG